MRVELWFLEVASTLSLPPSIQPNKSTVINIRECLWIRNTIYLMSADIIVKAMLGRLDMEIKKIPIVQFINKYGNVKLRIM